jgi:glutathione reductase (NADPH)
MRHDFDVLVIGTGTAGFTLALACSKAGRKVAVVDSKPFGGTCGMRGCEPEKYLVMAAEVARLSQQMAEIGINPPARVDWPSLIRAKDAFASGVPDRTERAIEAAGIQAFFGMARFISPEEVAVGDDITIRAGAVVIATGAKPARLDFPGGDLVIGTDEFFNLTVLPRRILFIGGGCLAMSLAHAARSAGAAVTILQRGERILKQCDTQMVGRLMKLAQALGINIVTGITASMAERLSGAFVTYGKAGCTEAFMSDLIVNTSGRFAELGSLDLEAGNVGHSGDGVSVNEYLQSVTNPRVWAIGDACASPFHLTSVADMEAEAAAANIVNGKLRRPDYTGVPCVVSSQPPLAWVGMTEQEVLRSGKRFRVNRGPTDDWPSSRRIGEKHGFYKVLIEADTEKILGAHLFGHNAGETINIFAMAIKFGLSSQDLQRVLWAYPTDVSDIKDMIS